MNQKAKIKKAYEEIEKVCEKHMDITEHTHMDDIKTMYNSVKNHLLIIEWGEKYGIDLPHKTQLYHYNYVRMGSHLSFNYFLDAKGDKAKGSGKYISWSDDGRQPKDEWLFCISFPTGAYIFGEDYDGQQQLFQDFFNDLKSYAPDYVDTTNSCLYWKLENSKKIYAEFGAVQTKYMARNKAELKARKIARLKKEVAELSEDLPQQTTKGDV